MLLSSANVMTNRSAWRLSSKYNGALHCVQLERMSFEFPAFHRMKELRNEGDTTEMSMYF